MRKRRLFFIIISFVLSFVMDVNYLHAEKDNIRLYRKGLTHLLKHEYRECRTYFTYGLAIGDYDEAQGKAYYYYGICLLYLNSEDDALDAFESAYLLSPNTSQGVAAKQQIDRMSRNSTGAQVTSAPDHDYFQLRFCNKTGKKIFIAVGARINTNDKYYTFRGWWVREPYECPDDKNIKLVRGKIYYYAEAEGQKSVWAGDKSFCVRSEEFTYQRDGIGKCSQRSVKFQESTIDRDIHRLNFLD